MPNWRVVQDTELAYGCNEVLFRLKPLDQCGIKKVRNLEKSLKAIGSFT